MLYGMSLPLVQSSCRHELPQPPSVESHRCMSAASAFEHACYLFLLFGPRSQPCVANVISSFGTPGLSRGQPLRLGLLSPLRLRTSDVPALELIGLYSNR